MDRRCEILISPLGLLEDAKAGAFVARFGDSVPGAAAHCLRSATHRIDIVRPGDGDAALALPTDGGGLALREGYWPDPMGMRFDFDGGGGSWVIESDCIGYRPIYYGQTASGQTVVSTRADALAALTGNRLSFPGVSENLVLGFTVDDRCLFDGVSRLRVGERLRFDAARGLRVEPSDFVWEDPDWGESSGDPDQWIEETAAITARAFERGFAIELSGGMDSRIILALALHAGRLPELAMTLGDDRSEDVQVARKLAALFGIDHRVISIESVDEARLVEDGRRFVAGGDFVLNASYAGLPNTLRALDPHRQGQVGGLGGEFATGGYYTPLDPFCVTERLKREWIRRRLYRSGQSGGSPLIRGDAREVQRAIEDRLLVLLERPGGSWRARMNDFYIREKMRQWGGQVVHASNCYYDSMHPMMHRPHLRWSRTLTPSQRKGRKIQMRIVHKLNAELGLVPYCGGIRVSLGALASLRETIRAQQIIAGKVAKRLAGKRAAPDLGEINVVAKLVGHDEVRHALDGLLAESSLAVDREVFDRMLDDAGAFEHELGTLISAGWALESLNAYEALLARDP